MKDSAKVIEQITKALRDTGNEKWIPKFRMLVKAIELIEEMAEEEKP